MVIGNAGQIIKTVRHSQDTSLLALAHAFELDHERRDTILTEIEERLRRLGTTLGGPPPPYHGYDLLSANDVIADLSANDVTSHAANVFAYEYYHRRRLPIMRAAEAICGDEGGNLVIETSPRGLAAQISEPFPGYNQLSTSPSAREETRQTLRSRTIEELQAAISYEEHTKRRVIMVQHLRTAERHLRSRTSI
jgi:hypothetical protein